jgi:hypothetical protein
MTNRDIECRIVCLTCRQAVGTVRRVPTSQEGVYEHKTEWAGGLSDCVVDGKRVCDQETKRDDQ